MPKRKKKVKRNPRIKLTEQEKLAEEKKAKKASQKQAIIMFTTGLLLLAVQFIPGKGLWLWLKSLLFGMFGLSAVLLPLALIYVSVMITFDKLEGNPKDKIWQVGIFVLLICGLSEVLAVDSFAGANLWETMKILYAGGSTFSTGGIFSTIIGWPLLTMIGKTGAVIVMLLFLFAFFMVITGSTLLGFFEGIKKSASSVGGLYAILNSTSKVKKLERLKQEQEEYERLLEKDRELNNNQNVYNNENTDYYQDYEEEYQQEYYDTSAIDLSIDLEKEYNEALNRKAQQQETPLHVQQQETPLHVQQQETPLHVKQQETPLHVKQQETVLHEKPKPKPPFKTQQPQNQKNPFTPQPQKTSNFNTSNTSNTVKTTKRTVEELLEMERIRTLDSRKGSPETATIKNIEVLAVVESEREDAEFEKLQKESELDAVNQFIDIVNNNAKDVFSKEEVVEEEVSNPYIRNDFFESTEKPIKKEKESKPQKNDYLINDLFDDTKLNNPEKKSIEIVTDEEVDATKNISKTETPKADKTIDIPLEEEKPKTKDYLINDLFDEKTETPKADKTIDIPLDEEKPKTKDYLINDLFDEKTETSKPNKTIDIPLDEEKPKTKDYLINDLFDEKTETPKADKTIDIPLDEEQPKTNDYLINDLFDEKTETSKTNQTIDIPLDEEQPKTKDYLINDLFDEKTETSKTNKTIDIPLDEEKPKTKDYLINDLFDEKTETSKTNKTIDIPLDEEQPNTNDYLINDLFDEKPKKASNNLNLGEKVVSQKVENDMIENVPNPEISPKSNDYLINDLYDSDPKPVSKPKFPSLVKEKVNDDYSTNLLKEQEKIAIEKKNTQFEKDNNMSYSSTPKEMVNSNKYQENEYMHYDYPPTSLLKPAPKSKNYTSQSELDEIGNLLIETLASFKVEATMLGVTRGPSVTRYEIKPATGVKLNKVVGLSDDIALNLSAAGVMIAPIQGKPAIGIDVPNHNRDIVTMREIIESDDFDHADSNVSIALGKDITGNNIIGDIATMPHMLIAGSTGAGKSVCINSIIMSLLYKSSPEDVRLLMIDPKIVELGIYNGIPHLLVPVVTDPRKAAGALAWAVKEMLKRYDLFAENNVRDIKGYNLLGRDDITHMPQIVIIIDELADLMMAASKEVEDSICRLAQMARAAGMHLIIATQRPSVDVITGLIKANVPSRISFAVSSQIDSRTILDAVGAEKLLGKGDMLFSPIGVNKPIRVQGCWISDEEINNVVNFVKSEGTAEYDEQIVQEIENQAIQEKGSKSDKNSGGGFDDTDELLYDAIETVVEAGKASTSSLQRKLRVGYARAARIIDEMEERGIVSPADGSKPRQVLISKQQWFEMKMNSSK